MRIFEPKERGLIRGRAALHNKDYEQKIIHAFTRPLAVPRAQNDSHY